MTVNKFGALILFTGKLQQMVSFYEGLGFHLEKEQHDANEPVHYACELGSIHFAIYEAESVGTAPSLKSGGSAILGWEVSSFRQAEESVQKIGARIVKGPEDRPWGKRMLIEDPDGRTVELWGKQ